MPWLDIGVTDATAIHDNVAAEISAIAEKVAPANADLVVIEDSAAGNVKKKVQLGTLGGGVGADVPGWISYLAARQTGEAGNADDDFFDDDALSGDWTTLTVSGAQTITEQYGKLSVAIDTGQTSSDANAVLRAVPAATGDVIETRMAGQVSDSGASEFLMMGLVWSDGVVAGSNASALMVHHHALRPTLIVSHRDGTFTNMTSSVVLDEINVPRDALYMRLEYDSANVFKAFFSPDGVSWLQMGGNLADTITPTHAGVFWSIWGDTADVQIASYDYFRYNAV